MSRGLRVGGVIVVILIFCAAAAFYWISSRNGLFSGSTEESEERGLEARGEAQEPSADELAAEIRFTDVTEEAGIRFRHEAGARGDKYNPETFGPGAGWFDYDGDGKIDLLLVNGNLIGGVTDPAVFSTLYRNRGDGAFEDVTEEAGLAVPLYGMGFVSADVDNDGDQDLLLYGLHQSVFFLNEGGHFRDATRMAGLDALRGWVCAAAFFDYDRDGSLDLFVGNYVEWSPKLEEGLDCNLGTAHKKYCPVAMFAPTAPQLFRGLGNGAFKETTREAGLADLKGKALGVAVEDYDRDGNPDVLVANDSVPNFLLRNRGDGTFEERGLTAGFATDPDGRALAGMGIDTTWSDNDGPLVVAIGNFSGEPTTFHVQQDGHFFVERSLTLPIGSKSLDRVTFGLLLLDSNLDGRLDLAQVNGHVYDVEALTRIPYRQRAQLFLGLGEWKFHEVRSRTSDPFLTRPVIGRALAAADYDGDGDLDLAVTENQGRAYLFRNDLGGSRSYLRVHLTGTRSNRDAIGAEVTLSSTVHGRERRVRRTRKAASSYLSQSERRITFGLLPEEKVLSVSVVWPSGLREEFQAFSPDVSGVELSLVEEKGTPARSVSRASVTDGGDLDNPVVARQRGVDLLKAGRVEEALAALEAVVRREPQDFVAQRYRLVALWRLAGLSADKARAHAAVDKAVKEVVRLFPEASLLVSNFALILRETGYLELAERFFLEAGRLEPGRPDVWVSLGNLAFDRRDYEQALGFFRTTLELNPDSLEALTNTGKIHVIRKDYARGLNFLEKAIRIRPDYATALSTLGGLLIAQKKYEEAERRLLDALRHARSDNARLEVYGNLGILYFRRGESARAAEYFEKVLEVDPDDRQAKRILERLRR